MIKEDFIPENIHKFLYAEHPEDIITVGSYSWFHGIIPDFEPKDYDYEIMNKSDHNEIRKYHYMYCDYWVVYFKDGLSVDDFINFILDSADEFKSVICKLICKNPNPYFNITYSDLEPYLDKVKEKISLCSEIEPKYRYCEKILDFMIENKKLEITEEQTKEVYKIYSEHKKRHIPKGVEAQSIELNDENKETLDGLIS